MTRGLGEFEQLLLFAVLRLGRNAYGVAIRQEIARQTGRDVSAGAVYTGLDRLQSHGYLISWEGETAPARGGRRRKYYRLEPAGAICLNRSYHNIHQMADGVLSQLSRIAAGEPDPERGGAG